MYHYDRNLPELQGQGYVVAYLEGVTVGEEVPNKETIEAIDELKNDGGEVFEGSAHDFLQMHKLKIC